jgi:serine/threonine-protein kinase
MGVVWKARDEEIGQIVALKLLRSAYSDDPDYVGRFERELELARRIKSPYVVEVFGYGMRDGAPYLALEYVDGPSLREKLAAHGPYSWPETRALLVKIAQGLAAAHAADVIHRDLKPSNVLVGSDGVPRIADFGIAKGIDLTRMTGTSTLLGTPAYLAPEGPLDERSDLYSLGIVAYELLTGAAPFTGTTYQEVIVRHIRELPDLAKLPAEARPIVGWLLAKDAKDRPQSANELAGTLEGERKVPTPTAAAAPPLATRSEPSPSRRPFRANGRGRVVAAGVVSLLLAGAATAAAGPYLLQPSATPRPTMGGLASQPSASPEVGSAADSAAPTASWSPTPSVSPSLAASPSATLSAAPTPEPTSAPTLARMTGPTAGPTQAPATSPPPSVQGGSCTGPSLSSPSSGAALTSETISFGWSGPGGCTFTGYTFRVRLDTNFDDPHGNDIIDAGIGGTSTTYTITGHDNQMLYWGLRADNAPNGASWSFRSLIISPTPVPTPTPTPVPTPILTSGSFYFSAATPWAASGVAVQAGDVVTLTASGAFHVTGPDPAHSPAEIGCSYQTTAGVTPLVPTISIWSVVGRVGSGAPFCIGGGSQVTANASGQLYVSLNDDVFTDNWGGVTVDWSVSHQP